MARFLIVDDSRTQRLRLELALSADGHDVTAAESGEAALETLGAALPDMLITDVVMPGISGFELCRRLRADPRTARLPVMIMTSLIDPANIVRALECGADSFLNKPYETEALLSRVRSVLRNAEIQAGRGPGPVHEVEFLGRRVALPAEGGQVVNLLVSAFEDLVDKNQRLEESQEELSEAKMKIEEHTLRLEERVGDAVRDIELKDRAINASNSAIVITDPTRPDNPIVYVNRAYEEMTGYPAEEVVGRNCRLLQGNDHDQPAVAALARAVVEGIPCQCLVRNYRKDGTPFWNELKVAPVTGRSGRVDHFIGVLEDATARIRAEAELRQSRESLANAQRIAAIGSYEIDSEAGNMTCSEQLCRILGLPDGTFPKTRAEFLDYFDPESRLRMRRFLSEDPSTGLDRVEQARIRRADGLDRDVLCRGETKLGDGGRTIFAGTVQDVTDRVALERRLAQTQKIEVLGQLTGGVAHDFNNLLTVMIGNLQMLQTRLGDDDRSKRHAASTLRAAERAAALTQQLLAFSRRQTLSPTLVGPASLLAGMEDLLRRTVGDSFGLDFAVGETSWAIAADRNQLEIAILNLVINARDACDTGGAARIVVEDVRLEAPIVTDQSEVPPGDHVRITVEDDGCGMSPDVLSRVFEPFFTTKEVGHGTGLGLSMVFGFVTQSGGHVTVDSAVGVGTAIRLWFPRAAGGVAEGDADADAPADELSFGNETILLVEDNEEVRETASAVLERLGYQVLCAPHAEAALAVLAETPRIDLLFTDVMMPGSMDGLTLVERARERDPRQRVLVTTGHTKDLEARLSAFPDGIPLIYKPYNLSVLADSVRRAIDGLD